MANNITADPNCISLWRFEAGAMLTDTAGNNDLTYAYGEEFSPIEDTSVYKEGDCSALWRVSEEQPCIINDANLSNDFPLKSDVADTTFSWVLWIKPEVLTYTNQYILGKMDGSDRDQVLIIPSNAIPKWKFEIAGSQIDTGISPTSLAWHHVAITHDGDTNDLNIRIYNENTDSTDTFHVELSGGDIIVPANKPWMVCSYWTNLKFNLDELAIFNRVLTPAEIDEIRAGIFGDGGGGGATGQAALDAYTAMNLGCPF